MHLSPGLCFFLLAGLLGELAADTAPTGRSRMPGFVPVEAAFAADLAPVPDVPGRPRVLLIGDSISIGYTRAVRTLLAGRATVHRPAENCGDTAYGLERIDEWLGQGPWAVIHFNFGLHDLKYPDAQGNYVPPGLGRQVASPGEYAQNLRALVPRLQRTGARLIFATTTPVPAGSAGRQEGGEQAYNEAARRVMAEFGVTVNDLHALVLAGPRDHQLPRNVHFTPAGSAHLARAVADRIQTALPPP